MPKFLSGFVLAFLLAVSFLAPVYDVLAETSASTAIRTVISPVSTKQNLIHNYGYAICPGGKLASAKLSFFDRLLAFVGITRLPPAQKIAENSAGCEVFGISSQVNDSRWFCMPRIIFNTGLRNSFSCSDENWKRTDTINFSPKYAEKYGIISCTTTHAFANSVGTIKTSCYGPKALPPSTTKVTYPPIVDVNGNGFYEGKSLVSAIMQDSFYVTESIQTMLTIFPSSGANSGSSYRVPISVTLTRAVFNKETIEFDYAPVPCTSITVAGQSLDKNCQTVITMETGSKDVTPKAPVPYYTYSVFVNGAITEK